MKIRLPQGSLTNLAKVSKISAKTLSDYAGTIKRPGIKRSKRLERACTELGLRIPAQIWAFGSSDEIKAALVDRQK